MPPPMFSVKLRALLPCRGVLVNIWHTEMNSICIINNICNSKTTKSLNKNNSQKKTTFAAYLTSIRLKNHFIQQIRER